MQECSSNYGQVSEWSNEAGCKPAGSAYGGSNPSLPTKSFTRPHGLLFCEFCVIIDLEM